MALVVNAELIQSEAMVVAPTLRVGTKISGTAVVLANAGHRAVAIIDAKSYLLTGPSNTGEARGALAIGGANPRLIWYRPALMTVIAVRADGAVTVDAAEGGGRLPDILLRLIY